MRIAAVSIATLLACASSDPPPPPSNLVAATDPEVAACRTTAKQPNIDRFVVQEIVIEADGKHRWMFVDPEEASTANHFGCRIADGKPLILPEG